MIKREYITRLVLDWEGEKPIEDLLADLEVAKEYGATHVDFDLYVDRCQTAGLNISLIKQKEETKEKEKERLEYQKKVKEEKERQQYLRLKAKYDEGS